MRRLNLYLSIFLFIIFMSVLATWRFVQSDYVAIEINKNISKLINENKYKVSFKRLNLHLFPPGITVDAPRFEFVDEKQVIRATYIKTHISLIEFFKSSLSLNNLLIRGLEADLKFSSRVENKKSEQSNEEFSISNLRKFIAEKNLFIRVNEILDLLPFEVHRLDVLNSTLRVDQLKVHLESLKINRRKYEHAIELSDLDLNGLDELPSFIKHRKYLIKKLYISSVPNALKIKNFEIKDDKENNLKTSISYNYKKNKDKDIHISLKGQSQIDVSSLKEYGIHLNDIGTFDGGSANLSFEGNFIGDSFSVNSEVNINDLETSFIEADKVKTSLEISNNYIKAQNTKVSLGEKSSIEVDHPFTIYDFNKNEFLLEEIDIKLKKYPLSSLLHYLGNVFSDTSLDLSGDLNFILNKNGFSLTNKNPIYSENISQQVGSVGKIDLVPFSMINMNMNLSGKKFFMSFDCGFEDNESINVIGEIDNGTLISVKSNNLSSSKFKSFLNQDLDYKGKINVDFLLKNDSNKIFIEAEQKDFRYTILNLGSVEYKATYDMDKKYFDVNLMNSTLGTLSQAGKVKIDFSKNHIDSNFSFNASKLYDLVKFSPALFSSIPYLDTSSRGTILGTVQASGPIDPDKMNVKGLVEMKKILFHSELINDLSFNFDYLGGVIKLDNILIKAFDGIAKMNYQYNTNNSMYALKGDLSKVKVSSSQIGAKLKINEKVEIESSLNIDTEKNIFMINMKTLPISIMGREFKENTIVINKQGDDLQVNLRLINDEILLKALSNKENGVDGFFEINSQKLEDMFLISDELNPSAMGLNISTYFRSDFKINTKDLNKSSASMHLRELSFRANDKMTTYNSDQPQIIIKNGEVEKWFARHLGNELLNFSTKGRGRQGDDLELSTNLYLDARLLRIIPRFFSYTLGDFHIYNRINQKDDYVYYGVKSKGLVIKSPLFKIALNSIDFDLTYENNFLSINLIRLNLPVGKVEGFGEVVFNGLTSPKVTFNSVFKDASLVFLDKNKLKTNGSVQLLGDSFPYSMVGNIDVDGGEVLSEFNELVTKNGTQVSLNESFLPLDDTIKNDDALIYNVGIKSTSPMSLKNSIVDVKTMFNIQLLGSSSLPRLSGEVKLEKGEQLVNVNNNIFKIQSGVVRFDQTQSFTNPLLDFSAKSKIDEYQIESKVNGRLKNFDLFFTSSPTLDQESIISLIAFGYTKDLSSNLNEQEKAGLTQAGIGSMLLSNLGVSKKLKENFGLEVNLGSSVIENENGMLDGGDNEGALGQFRSATTLELKKNINQKTKLSLSSTIGGSAGQRQSMNLDYRLRENISVQGVYETRTNIEGEQNRLNDNSLGADLKFNWSFD